MTNSGFDEHWEKKVLVETILYNLKKSSGTGNKCIFLSFKIF